MTAAEIQRACARSLANNRFAPANGVTWCNYATHAILAELGFADMVWDRAKGQPLMANFMIDALSTACREVTFDEAFTKANKGALIVAGLKMPGHGHVAVVYPFPARFTSSKWGRADIPCVANIGVLNGVMPLNWAFGTLPRLWLVKDNV